MMTWTMIGVIAGALSLPLSVMVLYLRAIREDGRELKSQFATLERRVGYVERDYTTKEETVREFAVLRQQLEKLNDALIDAIARRDAETGLATQMGRIAEALEKAASR